MAMARMFLAGCLWHAICLTFAFADSQCVDGQDSQREAAGLKSPSLVQLNVGRKTTLEMDTSSESLVGFSQMVQDLAEKVAGHNYTLKKAESDAIKLIRKWIENMNKTLNLQHKEDQAEVDRVRDLIRGCTSSTNKLLTVNVSGYNQTVIIDRNAHKNCREKQDAIADLENAACEDYDKYRKGLTPYLNGDEVPPSCLASLTKDKVATSVPATQDSMETCLVGTHTWLIPLYSRYKLCDRRSNNRTNITKRCDKLQETFESSFCSYELKLSDTCDYHSTCRKRELEDRSNTHDEVKISEQARKADYVTGRKVSCLFDVFLADNPNKTATLQRCRALQISTSPFDIIYHPVPPGEPCFKEPSKPCDEAWTTKEYGQLSAKAKTCTPCTAPTTAHTWGGTKPDMWLVAEDYDKATDQWPNRGEAGGLFDNVVHKGQLITATQSGHGAGADVKITAVTGTRDTHLLFRNLIKSSSSTLCTLTRYTGDHRQRILNGGSNWLWGHWGGRAGIAHTQTWITTHDHHGIQVHDWVVMCGQGANILANGKSLGNGRSFQMPSGGNVYVNAGGCCGGERSEFAIGEIMVWNSQIPDMAAASQYLLDLVAKGRVQKVQPEANGPAQMYRMDVSKNAGASYWCIEELTFYDASGNRLSTSPSGGAAETEYASTYAAGKAFNERTNNDESYYCSLSGKPTGWLQYTFSSAVQVASYKVERLNGHGNQYSPVAWTFEASTDGGQTWSTLDTQSGHASWSDGEVKTFQIAQASSSQAKYAYVIADSAKGRIVRCEENGGGCNVVGEPGEALGQFDRPFGVAIVYKNGQRPYNEIDSYLISDRDNDRVQRCSPDFGTCSSVVGTGERGATIEQLNLVQDTVPVYAPSTGILQAYVVVEWSNHRVTSCPADGGGCEVVVGGGSHGSGLNQLYAPGGVDVEVDPDDHTVKAYIVGDYGNNRVLRCPADGSPCKVFYASGGSRPRYVKIVYDASTRAPQAVLVSAWGQHRVLQCPYSGGDCTVVVGTGTPGSSLQELNNPAGVDVELDEYGEVQAYVVADYLGDRVLRCPVDHSGCTVVAGSGAGFPLSRPMDVSAQMLSIPV